MQLLSLSPIWVHFIKLLKFVNNIVSNIFEPKFDVELLFNKLFIFTILSKISCDGGTKS